VSPALIRLFVQHKRALSLLARLAVAAGILAYLFALVPLAEIAAAAASAAPLPLVLAGAVALGAQTVLALRLSHLIRGFGPRLEVASLLEVNLAATFYGLFLPAGNVTGLLVRFARVSRREKNYSGIALALVLDRVIATLTLCMVGLVAVLLDRPHQSGLLLGLFAASFAALLAGLGLLMLLPGWFADRWPRLVPRKLETLWIALRQARHLPWQVLLAAFALGIGIHLLGTGAYGLVAMALDLELPLLTVAWLRAAAILIAILPISVSGLGVREGVLLVLMAPYDISGAQALAFSLLAFASTTVALGLIGGLFEARRLLLGPLVDRSRRRA
jgi:hypothetical protein